MIAFILVALVWNRPVFEKPDSGVVQIEFNSAEKCEAAKAVIKKEFNVSTIKCVEIKK